MVSILRIRINDRKITKEMMLSVMKLKGMTEDDLKLLLEFPLIIKVTHNNSIFSYFFHSEIALDLQISNRGYFKREGTFILFYLCGLISEYASIKVYFNSMIHKLPKNTLRIFLNTQGNI